ncbi:hypothetical protein A4X13_0g4168 [Tilletia indica]|uniref:Uncharacterized protein n=1 Tax=Tilletia indica TaxID=43049 RepID=A0A177TGT5_9BASI|nr:hypothetical protein A4X13_0g4168 [Tilletia indica]
MRLIAVPLARLRPGSHPVSTFLAQRAPIVISQKKDADNASANGTTSTAAAASAAVVQAKKLPLASRLSARAAAFWVSLGEPNTKSTFDWKRRTHQLGERIMDTVEYDEWALKGIDPAIAPSLKHPTSHQSDSEPGAAGSETNPHKEQVNVPLLYPPSLLKPNVLLSSLRTLTEHRTPYHRKWFWVCFIGAPLTAPFALVPVIPNLPFFYLAWRAWSHWKAYQSSSYLSELIAQNRLVPTASEQLDEVYNSLEFAPRVVHPKITDASKSAQSPPTTAAASSSPASPEASTSSSPSTSAPAQQSPSEDNTLRPELLLCSADQIKQIIKVLEIDEKLGLATDLRRAMDQTLKLLEKGQVERLEAAAAGPAKTEDAQGVKDGQKDKNI